MNETSNMVLITQLPPEIVQNILGFVDPDDLAPISLVSRFFYEFLKGNEVLYHTIYLRLLDEPPSTSKLTYSTTLHDLVKLRRICASRSPTKTTHLPFVYQTVTTLLSNSTTTGRRRAFSPTYPPSRNAHLLAKLFDDEHTRDALLSRSYIFDRARAAAAREPDIPLPLPRDERHQLSAKLHCLHGTPAGFAFGLGGEGEDGKRRSRRGRGSIYPYAASRVYDMRQHTVLTGWGPFLPDGSGRVDWEVVEAVMLVLRTNLRRKGLDDFPVFANFWNTPFAGTWSGSYLGNGKGSATASGASTGRNSPQEGVSLTQNGHATGSATAEGIPASLPPPLEDPYGIAGTWLRVVCFLDYADFYNFNFPDTAPNVLPLNPPPTTTPLTPRPPLSRTEATRFILMKVRVTAINPPGPQDGAGLPVVHFKGISRALDGSWDENANGDLKVGTKGTVRLTPEGEVRWTTFSLYDDTARWRSEGIQVGGLRAARGVVGTWFDARYDPFGPCGPTAFWKLGDRNAAGGESSAGASIVGSWQAGVGDGGEAEETMGSQDWFPLLEGAGGLSLDPDEFADEMDSDFEGEGEGGSDLEDEDEDLGHGVSVVVGGMAGGFEVTFVPAEGEGADVFTINGPMNGHE